MTSSRSTLNLHRVLIALAGTLLGPACDRDPGAAAEEISWATASPTTDTQPKQPETATVSAPKLAEAEDVCTRICTKASAVGCLKYPMNVCMSDCKQLSALPVCTAELTALQACTTNAGDVFECDEEGVAVLKQGVCAGEERAMDGCVDRELQSRRGAARTATSGGAQP